MPAERPISLPSWAELPGDGYPGAIEPNEGRKQNGWANGARPPAAHVNWLLRDHSRWLAYLAQESDPRARLADALARPMYTDAILSSGHAWHGGAVSNVGSNGLANTRYWVAGGSGGNTALAFSASAGSAWGNAASGVQAGTLHRCAAVGTLCMAVSRTANAGLWRLGGATHETGALEGGRTWIDVLYSPEHELWIGVALDGIYTSPLTSVSWTRRHVSGEASTGLEIVRSVAVMGDRLVGVDGDGLLCSDDGITWTRGHEQEWSAESTLPALPPDWVVATSRGFWIEVDGDLHFSVDGTLATAVAAPAIFGGEAVAWNDILCVTGVWMSLDPRYDGWLGASFSAGVNEVLRAGPHGAISCHGVATAAVFGPTIHLPSLTPAV